MSGRSWAWVLAMMLAATACGTPPGELSPKEAAVPAPPEGVIVGIAVAGRTPPTDSSYLTREHSAYLTYRHQADKSGELLIVRETFPRFKAPSPRRKTACR